MTTSTQVPKLSPTFAVFVAGHRSRDLPRDKDSLDRIEQALNECLKKINNSFVNTVEKSAIIYGEDSQKHTSLQILTRGWEGSDRIAMKVAKTLGLPLQLITTEPNYNFVANKTRSKKAAPKIWDSKVDRSIVFETVHMEFSHYFTEDLCNDAHLAIADIMVLIWNGEVPKRRFSATTKLLREAIKLGRSVIWIDFEGNCRIINSQILPDVLLRSIKNGSLDTNALKEYFKPMDDYLLDNVEMIVNPLLVAKKHNDNSNGQDSLNQYFNAQRKHHWLVKIPGRLDAFVEALFSIKFKPSLLSKDMSVPYYEVDEKEDAEQRSIEKEPEGLKARFNWSDSRANNSAGIMRDSIFLTYLAFSGLILLYSYIESRLLAMSPIGQLFSLSIVILFLSAIIAVIIIERKQKIHQNWMSHRFIAEQLRYLRAGLPFLSFQEPLKLGSYTLGLDHSGKGIPKLLSFEQWILKRSLTESFFSINGSEVVEPMKKTKASLEYISNVITAQHQYHINKVTKQLAVLKITEYCVPIFTLASAVLAIAAYLFELNWMFTITAFLPAFAAIMKGVVKQKEIKRMVLLSEESEHKLSSINQAISKLNVEDISQPSDWLKLRGLANEAIVTMSDVNDQWQQVIRIKDAKFPD